MIRRIAAALLLILGGRAVAEPPRLLPVPVGMVAGAGDGFVLTPRVPLVARGAGAANAAARFAGLMATQHIRLRVRPAAGGVAIRFVRKPGLPPEGYRLVTDAHGATVTASDDAGLLYGGITLWQLATQGDAAHHVAPVTIEDHPRFGWRGLMLDSARHFQSAAFVRHLIDWMAANKLNRLHWHLVDDQGWRLQIRKYPRLTAVSAWRLPSVAPGAPALPRTGGFYTQAEVRRLVAYARARGITIVPEIEMPGHALAAIRAYPKLGMGVPVPDGAWSGWGVFPWLYNTKPATFTFLEDVLTEVMQLFPSPWIHVGGDEATKEQWHADPAIQAQIRALGLKDEDALQGWFTARIGRFLQAHGRKLIGWDEILEGGVPPSATVMSWRGIDGAVAAARAGHDTVLSPSPILYLDHVQGTAADEPPGRGGLETLGDLLAFDPAPAKLSAAEQAHVLGVQGNLWTEHVRTDDRAAWMLFPRGAAIAVVGWSPAAASRDLGGFVARLVPQLDRMAPLGLHAATSAWAVTGRADVDPLSGTPFATLSVQAPLPVHYTLDGSVPTLASPLYAAPLSLPQSTRVRATTFLGERPLSGGLDMVVDAAAARTRTSAQLASCSAGEPLHLEDDYPAAGPRARFAVNISDPCWEWQQAPTTGARAIAIRVGQLPWNYQIGADRAKIRFRPPATAAGEFEVRAGGCDGPRIAVLPLAPAAGNPGVTRLEAPLAPVIGRPDLCFTYTARDVNPMWAIGRVELIDR